MAESNIPVDYMSAIIQRILETYNVDPDKINTIFIAVHDNEKHVKVYNKVATKDADSAQRKNIFDNVDECYEFVIERASVNPYVKIIIFVGGGLVNALVQAIHFCEQVQLILITNKPPFNEEEQESMKISPKKVKYMTDHSLTKTVGNSDQLPNIDIMEQMRFTESISFELTDDEEFDANNLQCVEPDERSFKKLDDSFIFRYYLLMCLRTVSSFPSDKNELTELFRPDESKKFQETYSSDKSIFFYTKEIYIYQKLNIALRKTDICHLLPFRFVFQDICNQLYELTMQKAEDRPFTVYRGQKASPYEVADLFLAYCKKSTIMNSTFLSTSTDRNVALVWLQNSTSKPFDIDPPLVLFKIIARKQDLSSDFPFADISKISNIRSEKEVLFAPGQMFNIDNFDIIIENDQCIFSFEMSLNNGPKINRIKLKSAWDTQKDPLYYLGSLFVQHDRLEDAKYLYNRLLSEYKDINEKYNCYLSLHQIAVSQNNMEEAEIIDQKMIQLKFGVNQLPSNSNKTTISKEDHEQIEESMEQAKRMSSYMSFNRPVNEIMSNLQSDEFLNGQKQIFNSVYPLAITMMRSGAYDMAILILEGMLTTIKISNNIISDPFIEPRCYVLLGYAYEKMKSYDKASKYYELAHKSNIMLPLNEYIELLLIFGKVLEIMNEFEKALYKYIEVADIYLNNPTICSSEQNDFIEECIKRVISQLISLD